MTKKALGRGLGTLIPTVGSFPLKGGEQVSEVETTRIVPNRYQPRQIFEDKGMEELADSIRINGIIQPVIVRGLDNGLYELIAGERRWRAAQIAGLKRIPVIIKDVSNERSLQIALIENLQREDLNPIEAAQGYQRLLKEFNLSQEEIAKRVGKNRSTVTNFLRLLTLPEKIKDYLSRSLLTPGHAKAILSLSNRNEQVRFAEDLVNRGASVREAEGWAKAWDVQSSGARKGHIERSEKRKKRVIERRDVNLKDVEDRLRRIFGTKVRIYSEKRGGRIVMEYYTMDDLNRILEIIDKIQT